MDTSVVYFISLFIGIEGYWWNSGNYQGSPSRPASPSERFPSPQPYSAGNESPPSPFHSSHGVKPWEPVSPQPQHHQQQNQSPQHRQQQNQPQQHQQQQDQPPQQPRGKNKRPAQSEQQSSSKRQNTGPPLPSATSAIVGVRQKLDKVFQERIASNNFSTFGRYVFGSFTVNLAKYNNGRYSKDNLCTFFGIIETAADNIIVNHGDSGTRTITAKELADFFKGKETFNS
ncbi:probable serine/threonine-protein kinase samkC isoform X2 [Nilaparvata lugens]|uniref:probable serine/threonine-protein kinase samkC isoform X2 n=1 Tax=Nilaparvata lugens TaxID=108931 RepID=UPI00193EB40E|nr:probable serine/threonine-protein kinase samkC isoform X2 [Nilaparvata lugens]